MAEQWKKVSDIEGFEKFPNYSVSNQGRVRNDSANRIMSNTIHGGGYYAVSITDVFHKTKVVDTHRLVALAFIPNPNHLPQVNHKDEDKSHNFDWNLEWCTQKYNNSYGTRLKRAGKTQSRVMKGRFCGQNHPMYGNHCFAGENNPKSRPVVQLTLDGQLVQEFSYIKKAAEFGFTGYSDISRCCKGNKNSYKGYKWMYKEDYNRLEGDNQ